MARLVRTTKTTTRVLGKLALMRARARARAGNKKRRTSRILSEVLQREWIKAVDNAGGHFKFLPKNFSLNLDQRRLRQ